MSLLSPDCWSSGTVLHDSNALFDDWWSLSQELNIPTPWNTFDKGKIPTYIMPPFHFPPSPSETCSSFSTDLSPSPEPVTIRVVCDIPLVAPRPLPYHSPTFLQFDLPDPDEDLSHPPYTHRPPKRKRDDKDDGDDDHDSKHHLRLKRRHAGVQRWAAGVHRQAYTGSLATQGRSHVYTATRRDRLR
ncbi:hypothetical protein DEU56DRAFT_174752 [Suillus clintonianus]|uniref:uncharacterized protein n=1 Tax=Suillus clintonianus TaxID=1904413 RepID=UPI001B883AA6|nr:uncharacterized protein DEU56DRAFT_174752 [Suillus clintonianus]KAG2115501.1 hypothetical protein DEU56DRAFT_174752 [Suillus clintonianus]